MIVDGHVWMKTSGGPVVRRGIADPLGQTTVVQHDFSQLTVQNPVALADFRLIVGSPTMGSNEQINIMQVVNDPTYGKVLRTTLSGSYYTGGQTGIAWQPTIAGVMEDCYIEYMVRFNTDFEWSTGGKLPGLAAATGANTPPSGGNHSPYGFGGRFMWGNYAGREDEIYAYLYSPKQTEGWGLNRHTNSFMGSTGVVPYTFSAGTPHKIKQRYKMNTVLSEGDVTPPEDGIHQVFFDDALVYNRAPDQNGVGGEVFRLYTDMNWRIQWSIFRGGGDSTWDAAGPGTIDIWDLKVVKLA